MMVLKKSLVVCIIVLLMSANVYAITRQEFLDVHQDNLINACEDGYGEMGIGILYDCILEEFYGLHNVMYLIDTLDKDSEDWKKLMELLEEYDWGDYDTFDFMAVHLEFEIYLENKDL